MSYIRPNLRHPELSVNEIGFTKADYEGALSTLCAGCGHDSIGAAILQSCFEMSIEPHRIAKMSGIGCSSKTPAYFLGNSHGFNSVHGRMPSVATGANLANRDLVYIGVSGDGDTASIGMGQFAHVVRRNLNMVYIVMNNGCYGLTKGQDSATADKGSASKKGLPNPYEGIDLCETAIQLGAGFVARSFSGDKEQLIPLIKTAMTHQGFALIDVVSPCVTFNNNPASTKSYDHVREHMSATGTFDFVPLKEEIVAQYEPGQTEEITLHDGSAIHLHKQSPEIDFGSRMSAIQAINKHKDLGQVLTGLLYLNPQTPDTHSLIGTTDKPLNSLTDKELCPGNSVLKTINDSFK